VAWVVPATQTVHILALASVFFVMTVFDLQVMGVLARPKATNWATRPMPWLWGGLAVLAASGLVLILGEPKRELTSWPFRIKMLLVVAAALLTLLLSRISARRDPSPATRLMAGLVLVCWIAIIVCGRWIAYINFGDQEGT
jgi:FtsH-binding integral membrane protein